MSKRHLSGSCHGKANRIIEPSVPLTRFFQKTIRGDCVAKGVGMRNRGFGTINISGSVPAGSTIRKAFLYWAVLRLNWQIVNADGMLNGVKIIGEAIASPISQPCWNADVADVFRADVTGIATDGINILTGFPSGDTDSSSPFIQETLPLLEGASLVLVFENPNLALKTVMIHDGGITFFNHTVSTTFSGFQVSESPEAKTFYIVADGQAIFNGDQALFNNVVVAGPTAAIRPTDAFNGQDGIDAGIDTATGLWDTLEIDVSTLLNPGDISATTSVVASNIRGDCLMYIAQVFCVTVPSCPLLGAVASMEQALADALREAVMDGNMEVLESMLKLVVKKEILLELLIEEFCNES
ncbi:hypothetical protein BK704_11385 [[Bacillus thuringiensis] serovar konkukian]|nr:hypothetical protein [Bacillus thuringiensis]MED1305175.1 hypothetical protein [Bacillus pacificus]OUB11887.1 hypothetical protein BK704_11385 [[Bacillus thuringiensis] serovar konkukian]